MVAPGPSEEAFPAAAAAAGAFPVGALRVAAAAEAAARRPCRAAGRTSLRFVCGRAPSLMLGASRARLAPSRFYSLRRRLRVDAAAARELRWRRRAGGARAASPDTYAL